MSLSDLLYPGNRDRREKIFRRSQELVELMKQNFRATNLLIEAVNKHLDSSFSPITLNEKATVKENCDVMIKRVNQIQAKVQEVDEELKEKLEPTLYKKLREMSFKDFNKLSCGVKGAISAVCQIAAAFFVKFLMNNISVLTNITGTCARVALGVFGSFLFGVLVDLIVSAIFGYFEREQLEAALAEYEEVLAEFRPASEKYQEAIFDVNAVIKYLK